MQVFITVYSGEQVWPMSLLFIKTYPVKQYSYQNDFKGVFDALHQSFLLVFRFCSSIGTKLTNKRPQAKVAVQLLEQIFFTET